jgi:uncharacterized protein (TIGR03643 family)
MSDSWRSGSLPRQEGNWLWLIICRQSDEIMKREHSTSFISDIISMAWADDISFDTIKNDSGLSEGAVIKIMRSNLKRRSFKLWHARVFGRNSKHDKKIKLT